MGVTINKKYRPLWESTCDLFIITGGRGSGKSFAVGDFIENLTFEKGHKILYSRYTLNSASISVIPEFCHKIELEGHTPHFKTTLTDVVNLRTNVEVMFRGIKTSSGNQTAQLKSIEGLTTWVLEEAEELHDEDTFNKIRQSIRKKGIQNRVILVLNPKSSDHWIYRRFFDMAGVDPGFCGEKHGVCYIHTTYFDNLENLSDEFIAEAEKCKQLTPNLYAYDYMGEWVLSVEDAYLPAHKLQYYDQVNDEGVHLAYIDPADEGSDHFAALFGRLIGNTFYVEDAIHNLHNLTINESVVTERSGRYKLDRLYVEANSFGAYFIRNLRYLIPQVPIIAVKNTTNKHGRIVAQMGYIIDRFRWPKSPNAELAHYMRSMSRVSPETKDGDDAADCTAGMAAAVRRDYFQ